MDIKLNDLKDDIFLLFVCVHLLCKCTLHVWYAFNVLMHSLDNIMDFMQFIRDVNVEHVTIEERERQKQR